MSHPLHVDEEHPTLEQSTLENTPQDTQQDVTTESSTSNLSTTDVEKVASLPPQFKQLKLGQRIDSQKENVDFRPLAPVQPTDIIQAQYDSHNSRSSFIYLFSSVISIGSCERMISSINDGSNIFFLWALLFLIFPTVAFTFYIRPKFRSVSIVTDPRGEFYLQFFFCIPSHSSSFLYLTIYIMMPAIFACVVLALYSVQNWVLLILYTSILFTIHVNAAVNLLSEITSLKTSRYSAQYLRNDYLLRVPLSSIISVASVNPQSSKSLSLTLSISSDIVSTYNSTPYEISFVSENSGEKDALNLIQYTYYRLAPPIKLTKT